MNKGECSVCKQLVVRNPYKKKGTPYRRFKAADGRYWSGKTCPDCHNKKRMEEYYSKKTRVPEKNQGAKYIKRGTPMRDCQTCGDSTPNYYHCAPCYARMRDNESVALSEAEYYALNGGC